MQKKYKIYELVETSLESDSEMVDYDFLHYKSHLLRTIDYSDWDRAKKVKEGFDSLEEAEKFVEENIGNYDKWTVIIEYGK